MHLFKLNFIFSRRSLSENKKKQLLKERKSKLSKNPEKKPKTGVNHAKEVCYVKIDTFKIY